ncbi:MAG: response regulator transcription factor [Ignavibacteriae bacterium]|nr:response regulator transcription factor [Ignavibacteriota bacterium]
MKTKILIIEDDNDLVNNIGTLLEEEGYEIVIANEGIRGIEKAISEKPNLIICDIMMPGLDGYQVKETLNKNEATFDIPLLFLTARTDIKDLRRGMQLGADDYLFKPYKATDLLETIHLRIKKKKRIVAKLLEHDSTSVDKNKDLEKNDSIFLQFGTKSKFVKINSIRFIRASSQYSNVFLSNGKNILIRKSLNYWADVLPTNTFTRIHRSTIVNLDYVKRIEKTNNNSHNIYIDGVTETLILSRRYSAKIKNKLK